MQLSLQLFFECTVFKLIFAEEKLFNLAEAAVTMPRNEAKIYQQANLLSVELDVLQVRFAFVAFCL